MEPEPMDAQERPETAFAAVFHISVGAQDGIRAASLALTAATRSRNGG